MTVGLARTALVVAASACATTPGEPLGGDLVVTVDGTEIVPTVGAAIPAATGAYVVLGTRDISCATRIEDPLRRGTYVTFEVTVAAGAHNPFMSVVRVLPGGTHLNGAAGSVVLEATDGRLTGSATLATTDPTDAGEIAIEVSGRFDVARCF